jgi:hypothetical protein
LSLPIPKLLEYYYKNSSLLLLGCSLSNDRTVQVFRAIKQGIERKHGDIVIPQHFAIEQAPRTEHELSERNAYLAKLGITGMWFEQGQFHYIEEMLRLARNELRYRAVMSPGPAVNPRQLLGEATPKQGLIRRVLDRMLALMGKP